jgi:AcrR family transcriptional regulator
MDQKKLSRREREAMMHRQLILETAVELFSERGYENVSMQEIAHEAEFAVGTLYKFFENKEALYRSVLISKAEEVHQAMDTILTEPGDPVEILRRFIEFLAAVMEENRKIVRLYFSETRGIKFQARKEFENEMKEMDERTQRKLATVMQRAIDEGHLRERNPDYLAVAFGGMIDGFFIRWVDEPERYPLPDSLNMIMEVFLQGVQK